MTTTQGRLDEELSAFEPERTNLLPALHTAQELLGYLPGWAMERVGRRLHIPASEVHGVASGYTEFRFDPPPEGLIQICTGLSCRLAGADRLLSEAQGERPEGTETIPCLFLCSLAPVAVAAGRMIGRASIPRVHEAESSAPAAGDGHD